MLNSNVLSQKKMQLIKDYNARKLTGVKYGNARKSNYKAVHEINDKLNE